MMPARSHAATPGPAAPPISRALDAFMGWLRETDYASYDQYDFWATAYGIWSKAVYYRFGALAAPLVAPLVLADWLLPSCRAWVASPRRFPIADAHYLMGFLALYRATGDAAHLDAARQLGDALLAASIAGFSGHCWGYPLDWRNRRGLWKRQTPLVTTTPDVFDAFVELHACTGDLRYRRIAGSIAEFVARDIPETPAGGGRAAAYTPFDRSQVINASAYRSACLARAAALLGVDAYRRAAAANARFVVEQQRPNGAWPYSADDPRDQFVDHFHTCFVLERLHRAGAILQDAEIVRAVERGYAYYCAHLFHPDGRPRPYAESPRPFRLTVLELYDHAEALLLALSLPDRMTGAAAAQRILTHLLGLQTARGSFVTRISLGGVRNAVPYHRWGQAQAFCALARYAERLAKAGAP